MPQRHPRAVPVATASQLDHALAQRADVIQDNAQRRRAVPWRARLRARAQSVVALGGLLGALPLSVALPAWVARRGLAFAKPQGERRYALVLGAHMSKGLHLCRHLRAAGLRVIAVDCEAWGMAAARWSSSVERFATVPNPDAEPHAYIDAVVGLAEMYDPQVVIGSATPSQALVDALIADRLRGRGHHWSTSAERTALLDDKLTFSRMCQRLHLAVPEFHPLTSHQDVYALNARLPGPLGQTFLLKSLAYDPVARLASIVLPMNHVALARRLDDFQISLKRPWIAQAAMHGEEYSTYALAYRGRLVAYADTRACASNLRYQPVNSPEMEAWVSKLCSALQLDGQICVDFMRDKPGGQLMAIECNPRASTVLTCFHDQPAFARALCEPQSVQQTIKPKDATRGQYWLYHELVTGLRNGEIVDTARVLQQGSDALLDARDPWPFLAMHAAQIPTLLARRCLDGIPWSKIDLNIGKLAELGGE